MALCCILTGAKQGVICPWESRWWGIFWRVHKPWWPYPWELTRKCNSCLEHSEGPASRTDPYVPQGVPEAGNHGGGPCNKLT